MRTKFKKVVFAFIVFSIAALAANSSAAIITIGIEATVNYLNDNDNLLEGKVQIGSIITGAYTYDTDTPDTNPASFIGTYSHNGSQYGVTLTIGGFLFSTDTNNTNFRMTMVNDSLDIPGDGYSFISYNNLLLLNGVSIDSISWQLDDNTGTALSGVDLLTAAPVLSNWQFNNNLHISGGIGGIPPCYDKTFNMGAEVTSAFLIPEPASLLVLGAGLLIVMKRKK
jgi:hypothetical protein